MSCPRPNTTRSNSKSVAELGEPVRSRIHTAIIDATTKRLVLVSGYRDPGSQWDLRHGRCPGRECDRACRGYPATAVPYASEHQKRKAADMGGYDLDWLIEHRAEYGLGLTVRSEKWHFEASGTDARTGRRIGEPTRRIILFGVPSTNPYILPGHNDRTYGDHRVAEVQIRLTSLVTTWHDKALDPGKVDGIYGAKSQSAVRAFKRRIIALQEATRQPTWPNDDAVIGPATVAMLRWWTP